MPVEGRWTAAQCREYARRLLRRLLPADDVAGGSRLVVALLRELSKGAPIPVDVLATELGTPEPQVRALLEQMPSIEYDDRGRVVGYGLTLRETSHAFKVGGQRLYIWCALDALMFPAIIGRTAHVRSRCPQTGDALTLTVTPTEVLVADPAATVLSLPPLEGSGEVRASFCCHVNFFASRHAGESWRPQLPGADLISVDEGFRIGLALVDELKPIAGRERTSLSDP